MTAVSHPKRYYFICSGWGHWDAPAVSQIYKETANTHRQIHTASVGQTVYEDRRELHTQTDCSVIDDVLGYIAVSQKSLALNQFGH